MTTHQRMEAARLSSSSPLSPLPTAATTSASTYPCSTAPATPASPSQPPCSSPWWPYSAPPEVLATRPPIARALSRWGHILLPLVLIAFGIIIRVGGGAFGL